MEISHRIGPAGGQTITIELADDDDPLGMIQGLVIKGRLEAFLRVIGHLGSAPDHDDLQETLVRFGYVANLTETALDGLIRVAHDDAGMSWRRLESALETPQATIRRRAERARNQTGPAGQATE